jgi:hypothetical protein
MSTPPKPTLKILNPLILAHRPPCARKILKKILIRILRILEIPFFLRPDLPDGRNDKGRDVGSVKKEYTVDLETTYR